MSVIDSEGESFEPRATHSFAHTPDSVKGLLKLMSVNEKIARARRGFLTWVALQNAGDDLNIDRG
jgi:hypothetical protein